MSPEQVSGRTAEVDTRADVYSLGIVLYELLADRPMHDLKGRPLVEAARIVHDQRPKPLRSVNPAVPRHLAAIVQRCLAKDRESRYQTAGELSVAIENGRVGRSPLVADGRGLASRLARVAIVGVVASALILGGVYLMPPISWPRSVQPSQAAINALAIRPPNVEAVADPATALMRQPVEIHRDSETFRFAIRDVHQDDADAFLVQNVGMKKWMDQFMFPRVSYWAPETNDQEATLVYCFDFGGVAESVHLRAESNCWDFFREPGGVGRGASAIEVSRDGDHWVAIEDNIKAGRWGASIMVDTDLPNEFHGSNTLWVRVRCITESAPVENGYNVAQFARTRLGKAGAAFEVTARLRPRGPDSGSL